MMRGEKTQSTGFDEGPQLAAEAPEGSSTQERKKRMLIKFDLRPGEKGG